MGQVMFDVVVMKEMEAFQVEEVVVRKEKEMVIEGEGFFGKGVMTQMDELVFVGKDMENMLENEGTWNEHGELARKI